MRDLVYKTSGYHRALWKQHKIANLAATTAEIQAVRRYDRYETFAGEIYGRMFSGGEVTPVEDPPDGSKTYKALADQLDVVPEVADLARRCQGDEWFAGIATQSFTEDLMELVAEPSARVEDPYQDDESIRMLHNLCEAYKHDEDIKSDAEQVLSELLAKKIEREQNDATQAALLDETVVRNAYRQAAAHASQRIEEELQLMDAFGVGTGPHSGRIARRALSVKLRHMVSKSDRIKRIAELAGRLRRIAMEHQARKPRRGTSEVTGVEQGADMGRLVSSELLYAEDAVEGIFARKFIERGLLQQELSDPPPKEQGPLVVAIDSSGSMAMGNADYWAAAVALAFLEIARKQQRAFALLHFGTEVLRADHWPAKGAWDPASIVDAVSFFASTGGTDFRPPLDRAAEIISTQAAYKNADIILITDGICSVSSAWASSFRATQRAASFRSYAILIGPTAGDHSARVLTYIDQVVHLDSVMHEEARMHHLFDL